MKLPKLPDLKKLKLPKLKAPEPPTLTVPKPFKLKLPKDLPPPIIAILAALVTAPTAVAGKRMVERKQAAALSTTADKSDRAKTVDSSADAADKGVLDAKQDDSEPEAAPIPPIKAADVQIVRLQRWTPGGKTGPDLLAFHDADNEAAEKAFHKKIKALMDDGFAPFSTTSFTLPDADANGFCRTNSEVWLQKTNPPGPKDK